MPQVIEFPPVGTGADVPPALRELVRVCKETRDGDAFRELRTRLREAKLWDAARPRSTLRFLGVGGKTITRSPFMVALAEAPDEAAYELLADRLFELNPVLAKAVLELVSQRAYGKDEVYKHLGSVAYRGLVPSRPDLELWLQLALTVGVFRLLGIALAPGSRFDRLARKAALVDTDEFIAEYQPDPEPEIPTFGGDDEAGAPVAAAASTDTAAVVAATATTSASPVPASLRHLAPSSGAAGRPSPRGRDRVTPVSRFAAGFSDELLEETTTRIATWWGEAKLPSQAHKPEDFGLDAEAWVEGADEVLYRVAVAAALAFRLDADHGDVIRAFKALDTAGVLADLYHGTVPAELPGGVDARALMLASLAARRCAEVPDLASSLEQKKTAAEAFAALDAALGRGLFRIELLWILRMLGALGVIRYDDLPDYTALPFRLVRDTLFRLGYVETPYAADPTGLAAAARATRRAGGAPDVVPDEVVAGFALAAGCAYDCTHRKACEYACRERLE